jgi:hypothetical protein
MRAWLLCLLSIVLVGVVVVAQTPPKIAKQFTTRFAISSKDGNSSWTGSLALDDLNGGGKLDVSGVGFLPVFVHFTAVANPNVYPGELAGYIFAEKVCWVQTVPQSWLELFPLEIPPGAAYIGAKNINGVPSQGWQWNSTEYWAVTLQLWVTQKATKYGVSVVEFDIGGLPYFSAIQWSFSNTVPGPFDPKIYNPPNLKCISPPFGLMDANPLMHFKKLLGLL